MTDRASIQIKAGRVMSERAAQRAAALDKVETTETGADFSKLRLKPDHIQRPCWTCPDGIIFLEAFHDLYTSAYDFLVAIAEPVARPEYVHQYKLTPFSLYAAVATNIETDAIIAVLNRLSKNELPKQVRRFIKDCTEKVSINACRCSAHEKSNNSHNQYGKAKLVLKQNKFYVESEFPKVLQELLRDPTIAQARVHEDVENLDEHGFIAQTKAEEMKENLQILREPDESDEEEGEAASQKVTTVVSFQIKGEEVEKVKNMESRSNTQQAVN